MLRGRPGQVTVRLPTKGGLKVWRVDHQNLLNIYKTLLEMQNRKSASPCAILVDGERA
jgi:hypothetical protein